MFDFKRLISKSYLFDLNPLLLGRSDKLFLAAGIGLAVLGIIVKLVSLGIASPVTKRLSRRLFNLFLTIGLLEVVWFGARYENVRLLGTHFVALLILFIGLIWLGYIVKYIFTKYSVEQATWRKNDLKSKYLNR